MLTFYVNAIVVTCKNIVTSDLGIVGMVVALNTNVAPLVFPISRCTNRTADMVVYQAGFCQLNNGHSGVHL